MPLAQCPICERLFCRPKMTRQKYCSEECRKVARRLQQRRLRKFPNPPICKVCGRVFHKTYNQKYCSEKCREIGTRELARARARRYWKLQEHFDYVRIPDYAREIEVTKRIRMWKNAQGSAYQTKEI